MTNNPRDMLGEIGRLEDKLEKTEARIRELEADNKKMLAILGGNMAAPMGYSLLIEANKKLNAQVAELTKELEANGLRSLDKQR